MPSRAPRRRGRWVALAGMLCLFALLAIAVPTFAGTASPSDPSEFFGLNVQELTKLDSLIGNDTTLGAEPLLPESSWGAYLAAMGAGGFSVARTDASWDWVEPNAPANGTCADSASDYNWNNTTQFAPGVSESMDELVTNLAQHGIRFLPVLDGAPSWAAGSSPVELGSAYYCDYANFAAAFAARYGPNGSFWAANPTLPYLPVEQYEIWTEANSTDFWTASSLACGGTDPGAPDDNRSDIPTCASIYADAITQVSSAIHGVEPNAVVLASLGWQDFGVYMNDLYADLAADDAPANTIDGIGFHPYGVDSSTILELDEQMRSDIETLAAGSATSSYISADLPIYDTEDGQPAVASGGAQYSWEGAVDDNARAAILQLAADALARSDCGVQDYLVYQLVASGLTQDEGGEPIGEGLMGLWSLDPGTPSDTQPSLTADALIGAAAAYTADPTSGVVLCGSGETPPADLLPLGATLTRTSTQCVSGTITYGGNPLEGAFLIAQEGGKTYYSTSPSTYGSDSTGAAEVCLPASPSGTFSVYASLFTTNGGANFNVAQSPSWSCPASDSACIVQSTGPTGSSGTTSTGSSGTTSTGSSGTTSTGSSGTTSTGSSGTTSTGSSGTTSTGSSGTTSTGSSGTTSTGPSGTTSTGSSGTTSTGSSGVATTSSAEPMPQPSTASVTAPPPLKLLYTLGAKIVHLGKHATRVKARLLLSDGTPASATLAVWLRKPGHRARRIFLRSVTLAGGGWLHFKLGPLARGDKVVLIVAADDSLQRPTLVATLKVR